MIIDRTHRGWAVFTAVATVVAAILYVMTFHPDALPIRFSSLQGGSVVPITARAGGTPLGLIFGSVALLIFLMAGLLGRRRKHPSWRVGRIQTWLKAHVWLTTLTIPLVLFHSGFHGGGMMTQFLLWLYGFVMVSGFFGLALQHILPHWMRQVLPDEVVFEQIPFLCEKLVEETQKCRKDLEVKIGATAEEEGQVARKEIEVRVAAIGAEELLAAKKVLEAQQPPGTPEEIQKALTELEAGIAVKTTAETQRLSAELQPKIAAKVAAAKASIEVVFHMIDDEVTPFLSPQGTRKSRLSREDTANRLFKFIAQEVPPTAREPIDKIEQFCNEKRRLNLQVRMQHWLHTWIFVHAPVSFLLIIVTIWHAIVASYVY